MNGQLESWSDRWLEVMWQASFSGGAAILIVLAAVHCLTRLNTPAWVEHWLWKLVFLKLLLALVITHPIQVPVLPPAESAAVAIAEDSSANTNRAAAEPGGVFLLAEQSGRADQTVASSAGQASTWRSLPSWQVLLFAVWLVGVIANLIVLLRQLQAAWRIERIPMTDSALMETCRKLGNAQGLRRLPELAISDQVSSPALVGWMRPAIVFPSETLTRCTAEQLRGVLGHELSHYRRGDLWWNLLPAAAQVFFFFHPLLWLANRRWRLSGEIACDANAIENSVKSVSEYADSLLRIAQLGSHRLQTQRCLGCVSVFDSSRSLKQRLYAMKDYQADSTRKMILFATCIALIGLLGTVPWQLVGHAAEPNPADSKGTEVDDTNFGKNMGFEQKSDIGDHAKDWGGGGEGYDLTLDDQNPRSGKRCGRIKGKSDSNFGTYTQCINAEPLRGKRVRFSGYLRSDLQGNGGLWMRIDVDNKSVGFDNMHDRRVKGKTDWTKHSIVLDVPAESTKICFGFLIVGKGDLWADDFTIKVVGDAGRGPKTTGVEQANAGMPSGYANLDFEQEPLSKAWGGGGRGYELTRDATTKHSGSASGRIRRTEGGGTFGTFTQMFSAAEFCGKRVRYSGFLKTKDADKAGLWMRVDGPNGKILSFDNMDPRPVTGTTDWKECSVVLDVPEESEAIAFGFLLVGDGTVWGDDLKLKAVGKVGEGPASTAMSTGQQTNDFHNGDFEKASGKLAANWGGGGAGYILVRDTDEKHSGTASGRITKQSTSGNFGTFTQMFVADQYKGKRVRLSGVLKTKEANKAGLWMRIDGPEDSPLGFDNMSNRAVEGTTDWKEYQVVLDVPENATHIALGFLLIGDGTAWGDDLKLEVVGNVGEGPETTNMF